MLNIPWPLGKRQFYRATNPHSGCYFLTRRQAKKVLHYWISHGWIAPFQLSGPLEQAGSGMLLPVLRIMKPIPARFRFLTKNLQHQDSLWQRHAFEQRNVFRKT